MKTRVRSIQNIGLLGILLLLSACAPAPVSEEAPPVSTEAAALLGAGAPGYQPVSEEVCQILQEGATESLGLTFSMKTGTPFTDYASGETGQGCTLSATTNGASISDPYDALTKLVDGFIGWTIQPAYDAGGPTGAATAMTRDSGLMLISVGWEPSPDANCPADQPISACELTPEQKLYTVTIEAAQK
jgi:hypothetical protein